MDEHTREDGGVPGHDAARDSADDAARRVSGAPAAWPPGAEAESPPVSDTWRPLVGGIGLTVWLVILLVLGGGGLIAGEEEMAGLVAIAGLFATAQAADLDRRWRSLYSLLAWVVPAAGVLLFMAFAALVQTSDITGLRRVAALASAGCSMAASALTLVPWFTHRMCALLFRAQESTHTLRLTTRLVVVGFGLALTGVFAADSILEPLLESTEPLLTRFSPAGQTVGCIALALASVGYMVRRGLRETLERLGIGPIMPAQIAIVAIGVVALFGLNAGADGIQHSLLPGLWEHDQRVNDAIALGISLPEAIVIGLMAGIGEEITLRGALQPKLGLALTSLLFAGLHVQYSWFGMLVIFVFGLILGLIRARTNTTVAVAVHSLYDVIVLFAMS